MILRTRTFRTTVIIAIILIIACAFFITDYYLTEDGRYPIFCIKGKEYSEYSAEYYGLGYKINSYGTRNDDVVFINFEIGTYFMKHKESSKPVDVENLEHIEIKKQTHDYYDALSAPYFHLIRNKEDINAIKYDNLKEYASSHMGVLEEGKAFVALMVPEGSSAISVKVKGVYLKEGKIEVDIEDVVPSGTMTADMSMWYILILLDAGKIANYDIVKIV